MKNSEFINYIVIHVLRTFQTCLSEHRKCYSNRTLSKYSEHFVVENLTLVGNSERLHQNTKIKSLGKFSN